MLEEMERQKEKTIVVDKAADTVFISPLNKSIC